MYSLLSGFWKWAFRKREIRLLLVGADGAGKTTLLEQLKGMFCVTGMSIPLDRISPTVGLNIGRLEILDAKVILWDLGGQAGLRSIWEKYYEETHGVIFVIDSSNPSRFEEARAILEKILSSPELNGVPLLLFANKTDIRGSCSKEEVMKILSHDVVGVRTWRMYLCSALTAEGLQTGMHWLVDHLKKHARRVAEDDY